MIGVPLAELVDEIVPHAGEHAVPPCVSVHVTPVFAGSLVTVAVNLAVAPACTVAVLGATETAIPGITTVAKDDTEVLATEVAVIVTVKLLAGGVTGAL